jgi:hypothetical protein
MAKKAVENNRLDTNGLKYYKKNHGHIQYVQYVHILEYLLTGCVLCTSLLYNAPIWYALQK